MRSIAVQPYESVLPIALIVDEFLASKRSFVGAWVGNDQSEEYHHSPVFHASDAICDRQAVLKKAGAPALPLPGVSARRFAVGHLIEALVLKALDWKGVLVTEQLTLYCDWALRPGHGARETWEGRRSDQGPKQDYSDCLAVGRLDAIVSWGGKRHLVDVKSVHGWKFSHLAEEGVDQGYAIQMGRYDWLYHNGPWVKQFGEIDGGLWLLYVDKDTARTKLIPVDRSIWTARAKASLLRLRAGWEKWEDTGDLPAELPFRPMTGGLKPHWKCCAAYCAYATVKDKHEVYLCPEVSRFWEKESGTGKSTALSNGHSINGQGVVGGQAKPA